MTQAAARGEDVVRPAVTIFGGAVEWRSTHRLSLTIQTTGAVTNHRNPYESSTDGKTEDYAENPSSRSAASSSSW